MHLSLNLRMGNGLINETPFKLKNNNNMKSKFSKNAIMGVAFLASLLMLYFGVNFLKGVNIFKKQNNYVAIFDNVLNLNVSSPVLINGFQIGLVRSINMLDNDPSRLAVQIRLDKGFKVKKGSKLMFNSDFLGASTVDLIMNPYSTEYLHSGDTIEGTRAPDMMKGVQAIAPKADSIITRLDSIAIALQTYINHPAWISSINTIAQITQKLNNSSGNLNHILSTLDNDLPKITNDLSSVSSDIKSVSTEIKQSDIHGTLHSLDETVNNLKMLSTKLNGTDNSLGKLMNGTELHDSLNVTLDQATKLLEDIRRNPERYLSVRLKLF